MMWGKLNKADKTLLGAAACFFFFLCLKTEYPDNVFAEGLLFCSEAALVGGIADWFAVTAIFEKPLGFPYHTAILPRRREQFVEATEKMLKKEFFARKKLLAKVKKIDFAVIFAEWLKKEEHKKFVAERILSFLSEMKQSHSDEIAKSFKERFDNFPVDNMLKNFGENLKEPENHQGPEMAAAFFAKLRENAATPEMRHKLEMVLEEYQNSKLQGVGGMAAMMAGFAQSMNLVNIPEAAMLAQEQLLVLLDKLLQENSLEQRNVISAVGDSLIYFAENEEKKNALRELWEGLVSQEIIAESISAVNVEDIMTSSLKRCYRKKTSEDIFLIEGVIKNNSVTADELDDLAELLIDNFSEIIVKEKVLHGAVNNLFYDVAARSVLQAQDLLGEIVREVLSALTDKQINHLVYDKVEPDLLWIRMNGSIVGATIGAGLFIFMKII